ncbi:MAG: hypothetical protein JWO22_3961 [Frankiales bacterium]|nr:hypothetical protein [Frankiales bacterium]
MFLEAALVKTKLLIAALFVAAPSPVGPAAPVTPVASTLCSLQDARITESSGVAVSGSVLWTHNDSGDTARFSALSRSCRTLGTWDVRGEKATDWEDMARGAGALWFGDIGDNASSRSQVQVVRVPEPRVSAGTHALSAAVYRFRYEDVAHDAETLLVDPRSGQLLVVTKSYLGEASVYAAPLHPSVSAVNTLRRVSSFRTRVTGTAGGPLGPAGQLSVTAGDINGSVTRVVVRTYTDAYEWTVTGGDVVRAFSTTPSVTALPKTAQGEGIAYDTDGRSWITTSEGKGAPVMRIAR